MNRILTLFLCISLYSISPAYSQSGKHAVFLGLPLGGDLETFVDSLEDKGYEVQTMSETIASFTGMFDGVQCIIEVHATPKSHTVHQVSVSFSEFMENEVARMLKYRQIKKQLKRKYSKWDYRREKALAFKSRNCSGNRNAISRNIKAFAFCLTYENSFNLC